MNRLIQDRLATEVFRSLSHLAAAKLDGWKMVNMSESEQANLRDSMAAIMRCTFASCSQTVIDELCAKSRVVLRKKGQYLAHEGKASIGVGFILTGSVRSFHRQADGTEFTVNYLEPGHVIGLIPLFDGEAMMSDYVCHQDTAVALVADHVFNSMLDEHPQMARDLLALLSRRTRLYHAMLEDHSVHTPARRLASALLSLCVHYGRPSSDGLVIGLKLSQFELAMMIGMTRPTIGKELNALVEAGILKKLTYARLVVTDQEALRERASQG